MGSSFDLFFFLRIFVILSISSSRKRNTSTKLFFFLNHGFYTVVHVLYEIDFGATKSASVRDIVHMVSGLRVFTMNATNLNIVLVGYFLEFIHLNTKFGEGDMN